MTAVIVAIPGAIAKAVPCESTWMTCGWSELQLAGGGATCPPRSSNASNANAEASPNSNARRAARIRSNAMGRRETVTSNVRRSPPTETSTIPWPALKPRSVPEPLSASITLGAPLVHSNVTSDRVCPVTSKTATTGFAASPTSRCNVGVLTTNRASGASWTRIAASTAA